MQASLLAVGPRHRQLYDGWHDLYAGCVRLHIATCTDGGFSALRLPMLLLINRLVLAADGTGSGFSSEAAVEGLDGRSE